MANQDILSSDILWLQVMHHSQKLFQEIETNQPEIITNDMRIANNSWHEILPGDTTTCAHCLEKGGGALIR